MKYFGLRVFGKALFLCLMLLLVVGCQDETSDIITIKEQPGPKVDPLLLQNRTTGVVNSKEREFAYSLGFSKSANVKLIGFKTIYIDEKSVDDFNGFYFENQQEIDMLKGFYYDPESAQIRIYFPVNGAIIKSKAIKYGATVIGDLRLNSGSNIPSIKVIGRKRANRILGVRANIIHRDTILLAKSVAVDHVVDDSILVFDFGKKILHDTAVMKEKDRKSTNSRSLPCYQNHGGVNCTIAFPAVSQGRCPISSRTVCMDYNGIWTNCVKYSSGIQTI